VDGYLGSYALLGLVLAAGALVFVLAFGANRLLRPANPAEPAGKRIAYESGIDPVGGDWAQAQIRYYVYAYLYVLFAVEAVFLFPWAVIFDRPGFGAVSIAEMGVFVAVLALGIVYAWRKKILTWT
jgi:NADH-quinone oxidoreductase subunit A